MPTWTFSQTYRWSNNNNDDDNNDCDDNYDDDDKVKQSTQNGLQHTDGVATLYFDWQLLTLEHGRTWLVCDSSDAATEVLYEAKCLFAPMNIGNLVIRTCRAKFVNTTT